MTKELDSTAVIYSEADLIRFGNFLLLNYKVMVSQDAEGNNITPYQRGVTHADMCLWKEIDKPIFEGPRFSNGDPVVVTLVLESEIVATFPAVISATHHYPGKTKYDLQVRLLDNITRMYNIDEKVLVPADVKSQ